MTPTTVRPRFAGPLVLVASLLSVGAAHATLGGAYDTIEADRAHFAASLHSAPASAHTLHTLTLANHSVVREFAGSDGVVFAIAWRGPSRPDLRQLLGAHFVTFQANNTLRVGRRLRRPLSVQRSDLFVESGGRPGGFRGYAFLPKVAPAGFTLNALQAAL